MDPPAPPATPASTVSVGAQWGTPCSELARSTPESRPSGYSPRSMEKEMSTAFSSPSRPILPPKMHGSPASNCGQEQLVCSPQKPVNSPGSPAAVQSPMELLVKGVEQEVEIPLKTILIKILEALPCKKKPRFDCKKTGPAAFQAVVDFDVSWTKYSVDPSVKVARVLGDICTSPTLALESAVKSAFDYLSKNCFICVEDYSSKVIDGYENDGVGLAVNSTLFLLDEVFGKWSFALDGISKFHTELERKEMTARAALNKTKASVIYSEAMNFLGSFLTKYTDKRRVAYLELRACQADRSQILKQSDEKYSEMIKRGLEQTVCFSERDVLDFVVSYLGLGVAEYSNEPVAGYMFIGEVKIWLPKIEGARCGGRTTFHGGHLLSSYSAEEDAAGKALRFLESKLKVTIVDMNYKERLEAKSRHLSTVSLLHKIFGVAEKAKKEWELMVSTLKCGLDIYGGEVKDFSYAPLHDDEIEAVEFCASGILASHNAFIENFKAASVKIKEIENYVDNLSDVEDY